MERLDRLIKALEAIDHSSVEDCFLLSPLFTRAASALRAAAEREKDYREALQKIARLAGPYDCSAAHSCSARARSVLSKHKTETD